MSGDYSRQTFDPKRDFSGVLMQQGRVQLDADWNELIDILDRRLRAETTDIIGRCAVPKETPDGFLIRIGAGNTLTIGPGRAYVDGLLAENHGKPPVEFDRALFEVRGTTPVAYNDQPYLPKAPDAPNQGGPHLVYLDVWQREVTYLENLDLIEKAVGVDTTARWQTVWQVRALPDVGSGATCEGTIQVWENLIAPSAGRLSTTAVGVATVTDPCLIPPSGGYRGSENQLYRLEIHDGGAQGKATFKWSRDNASVATSVTAITAPDKLTVARTGRDSALRFNVGDWIEITDDWREFAQQPGLIRQIKDVDDVTQIITLTSGLTPSEFPTGNTDPKRHTRIRRWDQRQQVRDTNGNLLVDLDAPGSAGVIPAPTTGTSVILENGVQVTFDTPAGGAYKVGDYWTFAARTADASVEELRQAPPRGIHHHYCRLALVTFPNDVTDCRRLWPPEFGGAGCECSFCVTAESHNSGELTIQTAIDQVKSVGGTVCLGPGIFILRESPVHITGAQSLRVRGHGWRTILARIGGASAITVENSLGVVIEEMTVLTSAAANDFSAVVSLSNSVGVTLQRDVILRLGDSDRGGPAIGASGLLVGTLIRENVVFGHTGIGNLLVQSSTSTGASTVQPAPVLTAALAVQDNSLFCGRRGVSFDGLSLHTLETRLAGNFVNDSPQGGIVAKGWVTPGSGVNVCDNEIHANGQAIVVGVDGARINSNDISPAQARRGEGIVLTTGLDRSGLDRCQVLGNRIIGVGGNGISILANVRSAMIKNNVIEAVGGGGIVMGNESSAGVLSIENNQLLNIAPQANDDKTEVVGIRVVQATRAEIAANSVVGVGRAALQGLSRVGIEVIATTSARVAGNEVAEIGPAAEFIGGAAGIACLGTFERLDVTDNNVSRSQTTPANPGASLWIAVLLRGPSKSVETASSATFLIATENTAFVFLGNRLLALPRGREIVGVNSNMLEVYGGRESSAMLVSNVGALSFNHNRCLLTSTEKSVAVVARAVVRAAIASSNYLQGQAQNIALDLHLPETGPFTVVGNITSGPIRVNTKDLLSPWAPLNVIAL
jgi:hypothetical protein